MLIDALSIGLIVALGTFDNVLQLRDLTDIPGNLPRPVLPDLGLVPALLLPAISLAILLLSNLVGLVVMPALVGLLILIGYRTFKAEQVRMVWRCP